MRRATIALLLLGLLLVSGHTADDAFDDEEATVSTEEEDSPVS